MTMTPAHIMHILKTIAELAVIVGFFTVVFMSLPGNPAKENRNRNDCTNRTSNTRKEK